MTIQRIGNWMCMVGMISLVLMIGLMMVLGIWL